MIEIKKQVMPGETPEQITVSMIQKDLQNGISKPEMVIKYGIKAWEVDEMFKHPDLKGKRPARKRTLSFKFVDDVTDVVDPNQVTLEQAIDEAIETVEEAKESIAAVVEEIDDIFPTESTTDDELEEEELKMDDDTFEL